LNDLLSIKGGLVSHPFPNYEWSPYTLKMLGCFNPTLGQIWTNPNIGLKM